MRRKVNRYPAPGPYMGQIGRLILLKELPIEVTVTSRWGSGIPSGAQSSACRFKAVGVIISRARSFLLSYFLVTQKFKEDWVIGAGRSLHGVAVSVDTSALQGSSWSPR